MIRRRGSNKVKQVAVLVSLTCTLLGCIPRRIDQSEKAPGMTCKVSHVSRDALIRPTSHKSPSRSRRAKTYNFDQDYNQTNVLSPQEQHKRYEAQFSDVVFPLMAQPVSSSKGLDGSVNLVYHCSLKLDELTEFYQREMERLGWHQTIQFKGQEVLFVFKKQSHFCVVSIRPTRKTFERSKKLLLSLFIGNGS